MRILDGKKTYLGALMIGLSAALPILGFDQWVDVVRALGEALGIYGIGHKVVKASRF